MAALKGTYKSGLYDEIDFQGRFMCQNDQFLVTNFIKKSINSLVKSHRHLRESRSIVREVEPPK